MADCNRICYDAPDCDFDDDDNDVDTSRPAECAKPPDEDVEDVDPPIVICGGGVVIVDPPPPPPPWPPREPPPGITGPPTGPPEPDPCHCKIQPDYVETLANEGVCIRVTRTWRQKCVEGPGHAGNPGWHAASWASTHTEHSGDNGFTSTEGQEGQKCGCNEQPDPCKPMVMSWLECPDDRSDDGDTVPPGGGGGGGGGPTTPGPKVTPPGMHQRWKCVQTPPGSMIPAKCKPATQFAPNETEYPTKEVCKRFCGPSTPGPGGPGAPPPTTFGGGPSTPGPGGPAAPGPPLVGPSTGGPGGPAAPGQGPAACMCVPSTEAPTVTITEQPNGCTKYRAKFKRNCNPRQNPVNPPNPDVTAYMNEIPNNARNVRSTPGTSTCGGVPPCQGTCGDHLLEWTICPGFEATGDDTTFIPGQGDGTTPAEDPRTTEGGATTGEGFDVTSIPGGDATGGQGTSTDSAFSPAEDPRYGGNVSFGDGKYDEEDNPYNPEVTIQVPHDAIVAELASENLDMNGTSLDPQGLFRSQISNTLRDVLVDSTTSENQGYNGVSIGGFLYNRKLIESNISPEFLSLLENIDKENMVSLTMRKSLLTALKRASLNNRLADYTADFFKDIKSSAKALLKMPPTFLSGGAQSSNLRLVYDRIRKTRKRLLSNSYKSGDASRMTQLMYLVPSDYNLKAVVTARNGKTGVTVFDDNTLKIYDTSGDVSSVYRKNDFLKIIKSDGVTEATVPLKSKRGKAYGFDLPELSIIQGQLKGAADAPTDQLLYSFDLETCASPSVEQDTNTLKGAYLVQLNMGTITDVAPEVSQLRKTVATYDMVWKEGDDESYFNAAVSAWSGPRNMVYIDSEDPIWNSLLSTSSCSATYTDLDLDGLDRFIYPRRINTDMLLVPTNRGLYNPFQSLSQINTYTSEEVRRKLTITISPHAEVLNRNYVSPVKSAENKNISGKEDTHSFEYQKSVHIDTVQAQTMGQRIATTTVKSPLGKMLDQIDTIKSNYNLYKDRSASGMPQGDLFSFFSLTDLIKYILHTPASVREDIFLGSFTNVKVFAVEKSARETSYLTSSRLIGTDQTSQRIFTQVPKIDSKYFNQRFNGILFKD
jgi:hypothetical protein